METLHFAFELWTFITIGDYLFSLSILRLVKYLKNNNVLGTARASIFLHQYSYPPPPPGEYSLSLMVTGEQRSLQMAAGWSLMLLFGTVA